MEITLVDAFNTWSSGEKVNEDTFVRILWIFSYKSLIWQRLSKIIAFLSSFTIILDIIGEENIREYADKIDTSFKKINILTILKKIRQSRLNIFLILLIANLFNLYWLSYLMKFTDEILESYPQIRLFGIFLLICFIVGFLLFNLSIILKKKVLIIISVIIWLPFMILILFGLLPTIILVLLLYASNYIFLLSSLILKYTVLFIALVLSLNNFENIVSIVAFGLLILSFSLDLILS